MRDKGCLPQILLCSFLNNLSHMTWMSLFKIQIVKCLIGYIVFRAFHMMRQVWLFAHVITWNRGAQSKPMYLLKYQVSSQNWRQKWIFRRDSSYFYKNGFILLGSYRSKQSSFILFYRKKCFPSHCLSHLIEVNGKGIL